MPEPELQTPWVCFHQELNHVHQGQVNTPLSEVNSHFWGSWSRCQVLHSSICKPTSSCEDHSSLLDT